MIGDFGLVKGYDNVGKWIRIAEWANGDGPSLYSHAFVIVSDGNDPDIVEAEPGGARLAKASEYGQDWVRSRWQLTDAQRAAVASNARGFLGVPYSFLDYVSLALVHFHVRPRCVLNYVGRTNHVICSQLVDAAYQKAGLQMFKDGRFNGDVTPQDLAKVLSGPWDGR